MLRIGKRARQKLRLSDEVRSRHLHVVGASGTGKSKFLEMLIRQDIVAGRGVCVIDPHGPLADAIVRFSQAGKSTATSASTSLSRAIWNGALASIRSMPTIWTTRRRASI